MRTLRCGSWKEGSCASVCVALTMGPQPHLPYSSLPAPQKTSPKFPWELGQHNSGTPHHPCEVGWGPTHPLFHPQGEMRASICWVWQQSGADTSPEAQAELLRSPMSHHHCDPKTHPAPTPHSPSMGQVGQAQHPSLALGTECKAAPSASACSCLTFYLRGLGIRAVVMLASWGLFRV